MNNSPVKSELYVALEMVELTQFLPFTKKGKGTDIKALKNKEKYQIISALKNKYSILSLCLNLYRCQKAATIMLNSLGSKMINISLAERC